MGKYKAVKPGKGKPFELYDLDRDISERNNIADKHPDIITRMKSYAEQSHTENLIGRVLDKDKRFKGHQFD